jgi:large subunit ribosomal protein L29
MVMVMKAIEYREMTVEELRAREDELIEDLSRMEIQLAIKRLDNPLQVRTTRRELARVKTIINEKIRSGESNSGYSEEKQPLEPETEG